MWRSLFFGFSVCFEPASGRKFRAGDGAVLQANG
jgi:hypothetical protein